MSDRKRQQLKDRVEKGEARLRERQATFVERAAEVRDSAVDFAKENPLLVIVGGLALGAAVSMLFSRPRRASEEVAKRAGRKATGLAMLAAEIALPFIQQALAGAGEAGRAGLDELEELGETAGKRARTLGRNASDKAGETLEAARGAGQRIAKAVRSRAH